MPLLSDASAVHVIVAGAAYCALLLGEVSVTVGGVLPLAVSKNNPLTTAPPPPAVCVTWIFTWPCSVHTRYWPPLKLDAVRVSSSAFVSPSRRSKRSDRFAPSQSTTYNDIWCVAPSVRFTSIVNVLPYHVD